MAFLTFNFLNYFVQFNNIADFHVFNFGTQVTYVKANIRSRYLLASLTDLVRSELKWLFLMSCWILYWITDLSKVVLCWWNWHNYPRHVTCPVFTGILVFWKNFAGKSISEIHVKTRRKLGGGGGLLFTFVLLNGGVPKTICFVSIEQKK